MSAQARPKDFVSIADWPREAIEGMLERARVLRDERLAGKRSNSIEGASVLLYFEKPSLRTLVTFEVGVFELGGNAVYLPPQQVRIGEREPIEDVARGLARWCQAIVARTFSHQLVVDLGRWASVPVINALTDELHPCQAIADAMTVLDNSDDPANDRIVYVGDGNNMAHSLINLCGVLGWKLTVCTPERYRPDARIMREGSEAAARNGGDVRLETDPAAAVKDAAFLYTDVWTSMGQEDEANARRKDFLPYQINRALVAQAPSGVRILHCMPAHRDEEITHDVFESDGSLVFDQAENRLHAQKAILETLLTS